MKRLPRIPLLAAAIGFALAGVAAAQSDAPTPAQRQELDAARADLDRAAARFAELRRKFHAEDAPMTMAFERHVVRKPVLGVLLAPDPRAGVRIAGVTPDSAAAAAGLKSGDRLLSIDGIAVAGADDEARLADLRGKLAELDAKTPVRVGYERDGRQATAAVTPRIADNVLVWNSNAAPMAMGEAMPALAGIAPEIHREVIRLGEGETPMAIGDGPEFRGLMRMRDCKGKSPCAQPLLLEAFRWNGLNLASLDPKLGSYFGTDRGVLVLSASPRMPELQAGDVILGIDGKPVASPADAMDALRARKEGEKAMLALLRDHHDTSAQVTVPKAMPLPIPPMPPAPPAPPPPPGVAALPAPPAPPAPPAMDDLPAPPAPPAPPAMADLPTPPAPPAPPPPPED